LEYPLDEFPSVRPIKERYGDSNNANNSSPYVVIELVDFGLDPTALADCPAPFSGDNKVALRGGKTFLSKSMQCVSHTIFTIQAFDFVPRNKVPTLVQPMRLFADAAQSFKDGHQQPFSFICRELVFAQIVVHKR